MKEKNHIQLHQPIPFRLLIKAWVKIKEKQQTWFLILNSHLLLNVMKYFYIWYRKINRILLCFSAFENLDDKRHLSLSYRGQTLNDIDSISLTTDDLLKLPADGSFSFTYFGSGHGSSKKNRKHIGRLSSSDRIKKQNFQEPAALQGKDNLVTPLVYTNIKGRQCGRLKNPKLMNKANKSVSVPSLSFSKKLSFRDSSEHNLEKNYPRWLTSQKSDLNISGITSIPDFKYPVWLYNQDLLPDTDSQRIHQMFKEDQCSPRHSYQAQRTSRLMNKLDCFEYSFEPSNISHSLSEDKRLLNEYKCGPEPSHCLCENPLLPGSKKPFSGNCSVFCVFTVFKNQRKCSKFDVASRICYSW